MEEIIPVLAGEEIKRPLAREKNKQKLMSTWQQNERKKNECHMKPKNQQENEEYNEDKKQQITLKEKRKKKREETTQNSGRCAEGREKKIRKSDKSFGTKVFSGVGEGLE